MSCLVSNLKYSKPKLKQQLSRITPFLSTTAHSESTCGGFHWQTSVRYTCRVEWMSHTVNLTTLSKKQEGAFQSATNW